jgi:hypothetical protein
MPTPHSRHSPARRAFESTILTALLGAMAAVSQIVSGVGIMNIHAGVNDGIYT